MGRRGDAAPAPPRRRRAPPARRQRHAVVGLERRRLALAVVAVAEVEPHVQDLALAQSSPQAARSGARSAGAADRTDSSSHQLASRPAESSTQNTSCSMPVRASAPLSDGPSSAVAHDPHDRRGERQRQPRQQQPRATGRSPPSSHGERRGAGTRRRPSRAYSPRARGAPEPHRERALAGAPVGLEVAHVVDHQDRRRQQADRHGEHERLPGPAPRPARSTMPVTATTPKNRNTNTSPRPS